MISINDYLQDPCKALSIPYWKAKEITIPNNMKIVHDSIYLSGDYSQYADEPYFRLRHDLKNIGTTTLPEGYSLYPAKLHEFALHIQSCYDDIGLTLEEIQHYTKRRVYDPSLWLAVVDNRSGEIAASGIGELDPECQEGVLEWIQISQEHRRKGLGTFIVTELLHRMKGKASFCTVSGKRNNPMLPEALYRKCGFQGNDVWHILRQIE